MTPSHTMLGRMKGAALLDARVFRELAADGMATPQAAGVVALAGLAQVLGTLHGTGGPPSVLVTSIVWAGAWGIVYGVLGWLFWSTAAYLIGRVIPGGTARWEELLRTMGFAQAPGLLSALGLVPLLEWVPAVTAVWILVAGVVAIRETLGFGTGKAFLTGFLSWLALPLLAYLLWGGSG